MKKSIDIVNGKLFPTMIAFAIPLVLSSVLQMLYNAADSLILGRYESANALGAVGSVEPMVNIFVNLFTGISTGTNIVIARYRGAGDKKMVKKTSDTAIVTGLFSGIIIGIIGFLLARPVANLFGIDSKIIDMSVLYMHIYFLGMPFVSLYNFMSASMRGIGDTKNPMISLIISGASNLVMNIIFVKNFGMGVSGVAIATILSQLLGVIILAFMMKTGEIGLNIKMIRFDKGIFSKMLKIGLPAGIQGISFSLSNSIVISAINSFGAAAAAGNAIICQVEGIMWVAINSIGLTVTTFTSQYIGSGRAKELGRIMKNGFIISVTVGIFMSSLFYGGRNLITELFAPGNAEVAKFTMIRATYVLIPYCIVSIMEIPAGMLRGMGATFVSMLGSILGVCGIRLTWLLLLFPTVNTLEFVYMCYPVSWIITGCVFIVIYTVLKRRMDKGVGIVL